MLKTLGLLAALLPILWIGLALPVAPPAFRVSHSVDIDAAASRVWAVFTDTASYGEWNPYVPELSGELREGTVLDMVLVEPPAYEPRPFSPTVTIAAPGKHLAWRASLLGLGIFEHHFEVESLAGGGSRFHQYEDFRGLLCWIVHLLRSPESKRSAHTTAGVSFRRMNEALRDRVYDLNKPATP